MEPCHFAGCQLPSEAEGLCLFHMPKQAAAASAEAAEIAARFRTELQAVLAQFDADPDAEVLDLDGVIFPDLQLDDLQFRYFLKLSNTRFAGPVSILRCTFERSFSFEGATFEGLVEMTGSAIGRGRYVTASEGELIFRNAIFRSQVVWTDLRVPKLIASGVVFEGAVTIDACKVFGIASFTGATFNAPAVIRDSFFYEPVSFRKAAIAKELDFQAAADDGMFDGEVEFCNVVDSGDAQICFTNANLAQATFLDTDIEEVGFRNITWSSIDGRAALCDEALLRQWDERVWPFAFMLERRRVNYERLAENYRQLVLNYEKKRDYAMAEDFHIGEMETLRRRQLVSLGYSLYWALSKYGTSYVRAFNVLIATVVVFATAFLLAGFREVNEAGKSRNVIAYDVSVDALWAPPRELGRDFREACLFLLSNVTARQKMYEPIGWQGRLLLIVSVIALASQLALFLFAVRRRFKR